MASCTKMLLRPYMKRQLATSLDADVAAPEVGDEASWLQYEDAGAEGRHGTAAVLSTSQPPLAIQSATATQLTTGVTGRDGRNPRARSEPV